MFKKIISKSFVLAVKVLESHFKIYLFTIPFDVLLNSFHISSELSVLVFFLFSLPLFVHEFGHIFALLKISPETKFYINCKKYFVTTNFQLKNIDKLRWVIGSGIIANGIVGSIVSFVIIYQNLRSSEFTLFLIGNLIFLIWNLLPETGDSWVLYNSAKFRKNKKIQKTIGFVNIPNRFLKSLVTKLSSLVIELYTTLLVRMTQ